MDWTDPEGVAGFDLCFIDGIAIDKGAVSAFEVAAVSFLNTDGSCAR